MLALLLAKVSAKAAKNSDKLSLCSEQKQGILMQKSRLYGPIPTSAST
jgi:hypothetical protein